MIGWSTQGFSPVHRRSLVERLKAMPQGQAPNYPLIGDPDLKVAKLIGPWYYASSCGPHQTPAKPRGCSSPQPDTPAVPRTPEGFPGAKMHAISLSLAPIGRRSPR